MAGLAVYLQLFFVMGIIGAIAHDLFPGVTVNAGHAFPVVDVILQFKKKAVPWQAVFREATILKRRAVTLCLVYPLIRGADPAAAVVAAYTVFYRNFFDDPRMDLFWILTWPDLSLDMVAGRATPAFLVKKSWGSREIIFLFP